MRRWTKETRRVHLFNLDLASMSGSSLSETTCLQKSDDSHSSRVVRLLDFRAECNLLLSSYSMSKASSSLFLIFMLVMSCLFVESSHHILG